MKMGKSEIVVLDEATGFLHARDGGEPEHGVLMVPLQSVLNVIQRAREGEIDGDLRSVRAHIESL